MNERHLYRNSEVTYCAESLDQCWELYGEDMEMDRAEEEPSDPFEQIPDDEMLEVGSDEPSGAPGEVRRGSCWFEKRLAGEWARASAPGHFCGGD